MTESGTDPGPSPVASDGLPPLRDVVARFGLEPKRSLGQNFLFDLNLTGRIARSAGDLTKGTVIEVGPGPGGLTRALLQNGARNLIVIERDRRCIAALQEIAALYPGRLTILEGDALTISAGELGTSPRRVVANLPYNIGTALLTKWLEQIDAFASLTLMFQKEVVERLTARPRTKDYGRLSVLTQWLAEPRRLFDVPPRAFVPPPKVTSSVVQIIPRSEPAFPCVQADLERVTQAAFGQRRKMLRQSLKSLWPQPEPILEKLEISPTARAEELAVKHFCDLARALHQSRANRVRVK